jgi:hypothetical protein
MKKPITYLSKSPFSSKEEEEVELIQLNKWIKQKKQTDISSLINTIKKRITVLNKIKGN